jgi:cupredoxin-like protein
LHSHRRALLQRALATAAVVTMAATAGFVAPASAEHAADHGEKECRGYPNYPGSPNPWIKVTAEDNTFDAECLEAPANRKFRIYLENRDAAPHNISIYSADPAKDKKAEQLYEGKPVKGPGQEEYAIDEMPPGEYFFKCDKTDAMTGTLSIPEPKKK